MHAYGACTLRGFRYVWAHVYVGFDKSFRSPMKIGAAMQIASAVRDSDALDQLVPELLLKIAFAPLNLFGVRS